MISEKEKFFDPRKPFQSARPETHEEWQARMGGEVLAVVRSGLYLDFRFLDQALSALTPTADERCGVLATDGTILCYQPSALLRLYQKNPKYLNRLYLHTVFHCIFRHLWLRGKRDKRLWDLACDIAVENVIDGLGRKSVQRPLTWVRQHAYEEIIAQEKVAAAAPIYRWLVRQTPGVLRQLEKEFYTDDHRLWPKDAPEQPQQMPAPLPQKTWQKIGERMQTELELRDKEAGEGADAMREQIKAANRSRRNMIARSRHLHGTAVSIPSFSVRIHSLPLQTGHTSEPFETSGTSAFFKQFVERFFTRSSISLIMFFICWSIIHSFQVLHKQVFFQKVLRVLDVPGWCLFPLAGNSIILCRCNQASFRHSGINRIAVFRLCQITNAGFRIGCGKICKPFHGGYRGCVSFLLPFFLFFYCCRLNVVRMSVACRSPVILLVGCLVQIVLNHCKYSKFVCRFACHFACLFQM